jgi:hypothetical protein
MLVSIRPFDQFRASLSSRSTFMTRRILRLSVVACAFAALWMVVIPGASVAAPPSSKGTISGTATKDGAGFAGVARLRVSGTFGYIAQTTSDANGQFTFKKVNAGDYIVDVTSTATSLVCHGSAPVSVVGGQTAVVNVAVTCNILPPG